ncbi:unnamed protein product [Eruca vesicaria subsp. sativa]|uniref:Uncharacterized protein n=1 Tax=Eruca vesicaria subsp. sativa TaxID=29727 RepID=A0ABC8KBY4_ERUVS|nr:unnamed protein product [Eruca vesicaria subsp. sativa]
MEKFNCVRNTRFEHHNTRTIQQLHVFVQVNLLQRPSQPRSGTNIDNMSSLQTLNKTKKTSDSSTKSTSHLNVHPNGPSYAPPMMPLDTDDGISYKGSIHEYVNSLCKASDNILAILNDLNDLPEVMKQMPPLPVKVNQELAISILPRPPHQMKS